MTHNMRNLGAFVLLATAGCQSAPPPVAPVAPKIQTQPVTAEAPRADDDDDALASTVTTSSVDLVSFLESAARPAHIPESTRDDLMEGRPLGRGHVTAMRFRAGPWTCFVRRTQADDRATLLRTSPEGFLVVPVAWLSQVVKLRGANEDEAHTFFVEARRALARTGRSVSLARFRNGNAVEVALSLHDVGGSDVEVVAEQRFLRAGEYDAGAPRITIDKLQTNARNDHRGISVQDLLRALPAPQNDATSKPLDV